MSYQIIAKFTDSTEICISAFPEDASDGPKHDEQ